MKTRRVALLAMALGFFILLLAACTGGKPASSPDAGQTAGSGAGEKKDASIDTGKAGEKQTRLVKHKYGETEIPAAPKRIASFNLEDMTLSLQLPLVLAAPHGENYYLEPKLKEKSIPTTIWSTGAISFEAIMASDPDLILSTASIDQSTYDQMNKIAPTIVFNRDDWRTSIVEIGKALGMEEKANAVVKGYDDKVRRAKADIAQAGGEGKTVAFLRTSAKTLQLYFPTYTAGGAAFPSYVGIVYNDLGLRPLAKVTELSKASPDKQNALISQETLPELNPDYLFVTVGGSVASSDAMLKNDAEYAELQQLALWKAIPAVANGKAFKVSAQHWISNGPIADEMKVADVVQALGKK